MVIVIRSRGDVVALWLDRFIRATLGRRHRTITSGKRSRAFGSIIRAVVIMIRSRGAMVALWLDRFTWATSAPLGSDHPKRQTFEGVRLDHPGRGHDDPQPW